MRRASPIGLVSSPGWCQPSATCRVWNFGASPVSPRRSRIVSCGTRAGRTRSLMPSNIRTFSDADQRWFARVTGDANPLHLDAEWAATRFPGEPVVHGSHVFLWGLDRHLAVHPDLRVGSLQATFLKPVFIGDEVRAETTDDESFRLLVRGEVMVTARVHSRAGSIPSVAGGPLIDPAAHG